MNSAKVNALFATILDRVHCRQDQDRFQIRAGVDFGAPRAEVITSKDEYFVTAPRFTTTSKKYEWINQTGVIPSSAAIVMRIADQQEPT